MSQIKILWLVSSLIHEQNKLNSLQASVRLRCLHIVQYLRVYMPHIDINVTETGSTLDIIHNAQSYKPDLIIAGQLYEDHSAQIQTLIQSGYRILMDINENVFDDPVLNLIYRPFFSLNLHWCIPTQALYNRCAAYYSGKTAIPFMTLIPNPPEGLPSKPAMPIDGSLGRCESMPLQLIWTGRQESLASLILFLNQPSALHAKLVVLTDLNAETRQLLAHYTGSDTANIKIHALPWSFDLQRRCIMQAHATIITSQPTKLASTKSSNRIVSSFWFGTPVVAIPLAEYSAFHQYAILTENIREGLERLILTPWQHTEHRIAQAQLFIQDNFGIKKIGAAWAECITQAVKYH